MPQSGAALADKELVGRGENIVWRTGNQTDSEALALTANRDWFRQLFELSPDPTWIIEGDQFIECNDAAVTTLGYPSRSDLLNVHPSKLSPPNQADGEDSYVKADRMMALAKTNGLHRFEWIHSKANGKDFVAEVTLSATQLAGRQIIYCVWRDISERKGAELKLLQYQSLMSAVLENFPGAVSMIDSDLRLIGYNSEFKQLLELPDLLFEKPDVSLADLIRYNAQRGEYGPGDIEQQVAASIERAGKFQAHRFERVRPDGTVLEVRGAPLPNGGFVTVYLDITESKRMEMQVREMAFYDPLTELPNRRLLGDRLGQTLAESKRSKRYGAIMFLDLDNFKTLNDRHGHAVGDLLLVQAANRMKNCVREVDTVARIGGDEFVVVMGDLNESKAESGSQALTIANKIHSALAEPYALIVQREGKAEATVEHHCTASIGVVVFIDGEGSQDDFLRWADGAMYQAKEAGRNLIRFHELRI